MGCVYVGGTPAPRRPGRRRRPAPRCTMELALCPPPPASRPRRAGSRFHVTCTKKRNGFWGRLRTPLSGEPGSELGAAAAAAAATAAAAPGGRRTPSTPGQWTQPPRGAGDPGRTTSPTPGPEPLRPAALRAESVLAGGRDAVQRAGASERASRRLGLPFAHFLDSRHDPLDIIFGPAPGLGSNRPARHGSGGEGERERREREARGARPPGPARHTRPLSHSRTDTHSHTYAHTQSLVLPRARGPVRKRRAAAAQSKGGAARPPTVRPPGAAALPGELRGPLPGEAVRSDPDFPVRWTGRRADSTGGRRCGGDPSPARHTPWGWQTAGRGCPGSGWWPPARSCKFPVGRLSSQSWRRRFGTRGDLGKS